MYGSNVHSGRTLFDLQETTAKIRKETSQELNTLRQSLILPKKRYSE